MPDEISIILGWFASYSNFYSVLSVLVCFCIMVVFILRLNGDNFMSNPATHYNTPKEQPMTKLYNPFFIQISDGRSTSLKDGLFINVSLKSSSIMEIFWGVDIEAFQKEIHKPVKDVQTRLMEKETFNGSYLHRVSLGHMDLSGKPCEFYYKTPEKVTETSLGMPPRHVYPVVIVSVCQDLQQNDSLTVIAQFTIIHLKDSVCALDSHIVYQFVKTNRNNLLSLQPIYLSSSEQDFSCSSTAPSDQHSSEGNLSTNFNPQDGLDTNQSTDSMDSQERINESKHKSNKSTEKKDSLENNYGKKLSDYEDKEHSTFGFDQENIENKASNCENDISMDDKDNENLCDNNEDKDNAGLDETNTCIICQNAVIYYTLLPCRHACICASCVRLVDRCPMCRSYIDAFFRLYDQLNTGLDSQRQSNIPTRNLTVWETINQRLNEMLGFA